MFAFGGGEGSGRGEGARGRGKQEGGRGSMNQLHCVYKVIAAREREHGTDWVETVHV